MQDVSLLQRAGAELSSQDLRLVTVEVDLGNPTVKEYT
jgi:hypothetical protein